MNLNDYFTQQQGSGQTDLASYLAALQQANYNANPNVNTNSNSDSIADYLSANGGDIQGSYGNSSMMGGATGDKDEDMLSSAVGIDQGMGGMPPSSMEQGEQPSDILEGGAVGDNLGTQQQSNSSLPGNLAGYAQQLNNYAGGKPIDYNQVIAARMPQQYSPQNYGDMSPTDQKQYLNYFAQNMAHAANTPIRGVAHASPIPGIVEGAVNADNQMAALYNTRQTGIQSALTGATGLAENVAKNQIYQKRLDYDIARMKSEEAYRKRGYWETFQGADEDGNPTTYAIDRNSTDSATPRVVPLDMLLSNKVGKNTSGGGVKKGIPVNTDDINNEVGRLLGYMTTDEKGKPVKANDDDHLPLPPEQEGILSGIISRKMQTIDPITDRPFTKQASIQSILGDLGGQNALSVTQVPGRLWGTNNGKTREFDNKRLADYARTTGNEDLLPTNMRNVGPTTAKTPQPAAIQKAVGTSPSTTTPSTEGKYSYNGKSISKAEAESRYAQAESATDEKGNPKYSPDVLAQIKSHLGL